MSREIHKIFDVILKIIMLTYAEEFLEYIEEKRTIKKILNTEIITKKGRYLYLDFLCLLEDNNLLNIEFQFKSPDGSDLERIFDYNNHAQCLYDALCETIIIHIKNKSSKHKKRKIGSSKTFHPEHVYLKRKNYYKSLLTIKNKVANNLKLSSFDEIDLMVMCLIVNQKNKVKLINQICKMLKKEELFDKTKLDTFKAVLKMVIKNLISEGERKKLKGEINMTPQAEAIITQAAREVSKKYLNFEKEELLEQGRAEGRIEGRAEGKIEGKEEAIEEIIKKIRPIVSDKDLAERTGIDINKIRTL